MKRSQRNTTKQAEPREVYEAPLREVVDRSPIVGMTENQRRYISAIETFPLVFATGSPGSGKTYLSTCLAAKALQEKKVSRIIITRPAVECEEELGFLPGEVEDKFNVYLTPLREVLDRRLGKNFVDYLIKEGRIVAKPLAYMRGSTHRDAFVILDEAQNVSPKQMLMFLTRIGENCQVVVTGDETQSDIRGLSGLSDAISRVSYIPSVKVIRFTRDDVVRSGLVGEILEAYGQ